MTSDLDSLKQELLDYLASEGFAVFRGQAGMLEGESGVAWDTDEHPEYQGYLNVAKIAGASIIVFAHRQLESEEIEEAIEQLAECEFGRDEQRSIERTLTDMRAHVGATCVIEMAFDYQGRMYVYELTAEWFQTFLDLSDLLLATSTAGADDEDEADSSFGGYYSKN